MSLCLEPWGPNTALLIRKSLGYLALIGLAAFLYRLYQVRMLFRRVQKEHGIPILPHSFIFGHLVTIAKASIKYRIPRDAHGHWIFYHLKREYPDLLNRGIMYMDPWPIGYPMIAVYHPDLMAQFIQENSLPKYWAMGQVEFGAFTGGEDLLNLDGPEWKKARSIFNPGFSARNLLSLVPNMIEEVLVFQERLRKAVASEQVVRLEDYTTDIAVDIVGCAVLGTRLETQVKPNRLMATMKSQIRLIFFELDIMKLLNPIRVFKNLIYNRIIRNELVPLISNTAQNYEKVGGPKTIISLALKSYINEAQGYSTRGNIPYDFIERVVKHIKIFMFAGHDTTATVLAYIYYLLSKHPDKAAKIRAEHNEVLGVDPTTAADRIRADPTLLNKMPYTIAVLRETLRLYPPVGGSIRQSPPGHFLTHPETGVRYPTYGFMLHSSASTIQRDPEYWHDADSFIPERFMTHNGNDPLYPVRNTWRPFELGPRACIGQELVSVEVRLILALTVREFQVEEAYPMDAPEWMGDKAYQVVDPEDVAAAHIKDGLPVRIKSINLN
ncbi:cytochrome P450 [Annulohypoxylon maeteangense]|uniref:cytochrome P450 n=1 Tax=Annulohypoxylon maeteangense TaxID=1927788 RepID=UPI00200727AC|nr:cytochrome P450 [Annulohypoxylon maeteangense]KAI0889436.1 cytochrome P450 [Annulohypoxylon maeteangense]